MRDAVEENIRTGSAPLRHCSTVLLNAIDSYRPGDQRNNELWETIAWLNPPYANLKATDMKPLTAKDIGRRLRSVTMEILQEEWEGYCTLVAQPIVMGDVSPTGGNGSATCGRVFASRAVLHLHPAVVTACDSFFSVEGYVIGASVTSGRT